MCLQVCSFKTYVFKNHSAFKKKKFNADHYLICYNVASVLHFVFFFTMKHVES